MPTRALIVCGLIAALSIFSGCRGTFAPQSETMLEKNWGRSFETAKYNQIVNPEAGKNLDPVLGVDGQVAERIIEKYRKEEPVVVFREYGIFTFKK